MSIGPFWRYYGGKWRAAPRYPAPSYGLIVEPFAGAAGYACRYPDRDVLLIDADPVIVSIWRWLIDATPADVLAVGDVPDGGTVDDIDAPQAARWLVGFWCNNGAAAPRKSPSPWAQRGQHGQGWGGWGPRTRQRIARWVPKIKHWKVRSGDYSQAPNQAATWFVDPPYQTAAGRHYRHSEINHAVLSRWVMSRRGQVIACDQAGADWLPWNWERDCRSTRGKSAEVAYVRNEMGLFQETAP